VITPSRLGAIGAALLVGTTLALTASSAHADGGAGRTWVSGAGDDANPCSRTAPCKTFAGALANTMAGGEIDVLDPGGFGAVTITKSITIDGGGFVAGVLTGGTDGIVIQAGPTDSVVLRNLGLHDATTGSGSCALSGVRVVSAGSVQLQHLSIAGYDDGISLPLTASTPGTYVDTTLDDVSVAGARCAGVDATPDSGHLARVAVSGSLVTRDATGYVAGPGSESWLSGSSIVFNGTGLSGTGVLHDVCGNTVAGNGVAGAFSDHAAGCVPATAGDTTHTGSTATGGAATSAAGYCVVPKLTGKKKAAAARALRAAGCASGKVTKKKGTKAKRGKVLRQSVPAGISVKPGTAVTIVVGR
jgi:hypothetical protein